jgi:hypothetical protein
MPLPSTVRVKLSSEAAGAISLTPVVVQELAMRDLIEQILGITGKDEVRIAELILRGTLVTGASRFRWQGWDPDRDEVRELLATFPDPDPSRAFLPAACIRAILRGGRQSIELPRETVARRGVFQRQSFWDELMKISGSGAAAYQTYSYRDRCDRFVRDLSHAEVEHLHAASGSVKFSTLRDQIRSVAFTAVELYTTR